MYIRVKKSRHAGFTPKSRPPSLPIKAASGRFISVLRGQRIHLDVAISVNHEHIRCECISRVCRVAIESRKYDRVDFELPGQ